MKVLRLRYCNGKPYTWVHIADDNGVPLCGRVYGNDYELLQEDADISTLTMATLCSQCAAVHFEFSFECLQAGQARRYGPTWYKYHITDLADTPRDRDAVLSFCQAWLKRSYLKKDMSSPFAPQMRECTQIRDRTWRYHVRLESTS